VPDESVFRRQFIAALQGDGDTNQDGYVTGVELGEFLSNTVGNYSKGTQHPQYGKIRDPNLDKGDFVFPLANSPTSIDPGEKVTKFTPKAPEIERSLLSVQKRNREIEKEMEALKLANEKAKQKDAERLLNEGIKFFEARKYELTMEKMKEALRLHPENEEAKIYLKMSKNRLEDIHNKWETGRRGPRVIKKRK